VTFVIIYKKNDVTERMVHGMFFLGGNFCPVFFVR